MKKHKVKRLAMALIAATAMSGIVSPISAYEMDATMLLQNVAVMVQEEDAAGAAALVRQLSELGITGISVDGDTISIEDLLALIAAAQGNPAALAELVAMVNAAVASGSVFVAGDIIVATIDTDDFAANQTGSVFPGGSTG